MIKTRDKCNKCNDQLTKDNWIIDNHSSYKIKARCKKCNKKLSTKRNCLHCGIIKSEEVKRIKYCSKECLIKHNIIEKDGCSIWNFTLDNTDLPIASFLHKSFSIKRYLYSKKHGPIKNNFILVSSCEHKSCVNPEHLTKTTSSVLLNQLGRRALKISKENILEIKKLYFDYNWPKVQIGKKLNVSDVTIGTVIKKITEINITPMEVNSDIAMQQMLDEINKTLGD